MEFETGRYKITVDELQKGGPGGYESVYLTSEGYPASPGLREVLDKFSGSLLPNDNNSIRQRNGENLVTALEESRSVGIASGFKPSGAYHFGHKLTSETVAFFQRNGAQVFVPVADIECAMDSKLTQEEYQFWAADNLLDWGANGVDLDAAHVYLQSEEFRVNMLSYVVARSLRFDLAADIYGADKLIDDFPFLFAGITQVGDILLPQHNDFGNHHSFMVSGQDQDGHMKMTTALTKVTLDSGIDLLGVTTIPSAFYIPHIRGTDGEKMSSSRPEYTIYLGQGAEEEDLVERTRRSMKKINEADTDYLERCSLDMVRYLDCFNGLSRVSFRELCSQPRYLELSEALETADTRENQLKAQYDIDAYLIARCREQSQDNAEIVRDSLPDALKDHQKKREILLAYAIDRTKNHGSAQDVKKPEFWQTPDKTAVNELSPNPTQWYNLVANVAARINP